MEVEATCTKTVLVQLGTFSRVVEFECSRNRLSGGATERELLIERIRAAYSERVEAADRLTLQVQRKEWGDGVFVDYFGSEIEDKSIIRLVVEKPEKSEVKDGQVSINPVSERVT